MTKNTEVKNISDRFSFFPDLKEDEKIRLLEGLSFKVVKKNQLILPSDNTSIQIYLLMKGSIRAVVDSESGKTVTVKKYDKNTCIVMLSKYYLGFEININLLADEDCELAFVPNSLANNLFVNNLAVKDFAIKEICDLLSGAVEMLRQITYKDLPCKLALWIVEHCRLSNDCVIKITHEKIAQELASVREVVSRNLKKFEQQGYVQLYRGRIKVIKLEALQEIANV